MRIPPALAPARRARALWRWVRRAPVLALWHSTRLLALCVVLALGLGAGLSLTLAAALRTESGSRLLLDRLPFVEAEGIRGAFLGDFCVDRLAIRWNRVGDGLDMHGLCAQGFSLDGWRARAPFVQLHWGQAQARSVRLVHPPTSPHDSPLPSSLVSPVGLELSQVRIDRFLLPGLGESGLQEVRGHLHLGSPGGRTHALRLEHVRWGHLKGHGSAELQAKAPFELTAQVQARSQGSSDSALAPLALRAHMSGGLQALTLSLEAAAISEAGGETKVSQPPPPDGALLKARMQIHPFKAWAWGQATAQAQDLNLQSIHPSWPHTRVFGDGLWQSGPGRWLVKADLRNEAAAPLDQGAWPFRRLQCELQSSGASTARPAGFWVAPALRVPNCLVVLGEGQRDAGSVRLSGQAHAKGWRVKAQIENLQAQALDTRAAALRFSGPAELELQVMEPAHSQPPKLAVNAQLQGQWQSPVLAGKTLPAALQLSAQARWPHWPGLPSGSPTEASAPVARGTGASPLGVASIEIQRLRLQVGEALASVQLAGQQSGQSPWRARGELTLGAFDPQMLWLGPEGSTWRLSTHRLNARGEFDLQGAAPSAGRPWQGAWPHQGRAELTLQASRVAGVAVSGSLALTQARPKAALALLAQLDASGNQLRIEGLLPPEPPTKRTANQPTAPSAGDSPGGQEPSWRAELKARDMAVLTPWARMGLEFLHQAEAAKALRLSGQLNSQFDLQGRWPALRSSGWLQAQDLHLGQAELGQGRLDWQTAHPGALPAATQRIDARLSGLSWAQRPVAKRLHLLLNGSAREHTVTAGVSSEALPPAWALAIRATGESAAPQGSIAWEPGERTVAWGHWQGGLVTSDPAHAGILSVQGWRGMARSLLAQSRSDDRMPAQTWLEGLDLALNVQWADSAGRPQPLRIESAGGQGQMAGAPVQWKHGWWQEGEPGGPPQGQLQLNMGPVPVAPLLNQLQPELGWSGDLRLTGQLRLSTRPQLIIESVLERESGDLRLSDERGSRPLGLKDLRWSLDARDGLWTWTQAIHGHNLGQTAAAITLQGHAQDRWPQADWPLQGVLELQVADLATWVPWLPAGWRLGGTLRSGAQLGGTLGEPRFQGHVQGQGVSVRNMAEGVNLQEGQFKVKLDERQLELESLRVQGGKGQLQASGRAQWSQPERRTPWSPLEGQLQFEAQRFALLSRVDRRLVLSGQGAVQTDASQSAIRGQLRVDEGYFDVTRQDAPSLPADVTVNRPASASPATAPQASAPKEPQKDCVWLGRRCAADLRLDMGDALRLKWRGLQTRLTGSLAWVSRNGRPQLEGLIATSSDSTFTTYGQRLNIERGLLTVSGPLEHPRLDAEIEATRKLNDFANPVRGGATEVTRVGVLLEGTLPNLRPKLFSEPNTLDENEKLSWLVLGRSPDSSDRGNALLQQAALGLLLGDGDSMSLQQFGLDDLALSATSVRFGKQLSDRLYFGYERGISTANEGFQLIYSIARQFSISAQQFQDSSKQLKLNWTWRWKD
jgi:translocation and assembly module TamB